MNILRIDTSSNKEVVVGLKINKIEYAIQKQINHQKAQAVLPLVEKMLKKHNLSVGDIQSIEVSPGPGSFTGIRVGMAIANALALALKIPVKKI